MLRRTWAMAQKEFIQLFRERVFIIVLLMMPILQLALFAAAIHTDITHIPMVVADQSLSQASQSYLNALVDSNYFDIVANVSSQDDLMKAIDDGNANVGVLIPPDFASKVTQGQANVLVLVDGSDSYITNSAYSTINAISQTYAISLIRLPATPLNMSIRILYNPDLNQLWFLVPGLLVMLMQGITMNLTALAIVREREVGTIEALLVTPLRPVELMLGKTLPYLAVALVNMMSIFFFSTVIFGVPFMGNLLLFVFLSIIFATTGLGLGLAISTGSQTQMQAQQLGGMFNFVGMFLAGFLFPAYALPLVLKVIGAIFPMTYFLPIVRGVFTKGVGLSGIWQPVVASLFLMFIILFAATRLFRQSLD
ncbi:MAG: ABC transporter permease [Anaerolineaceae bacterium]|nr:ABC transporter permease [Anaerolineaceae bacterium]